MSGADPGMREGPVLDTVVTRAFAVRTPPGTRTLNPLIKSQLLCQLS